MSLYAVKNDEGKWLGCEVNEFDLGWYKHGGFIFDSEDKAKNNTERYGGHVVELVEAPAKVVVSENEAEMLKRASKDVIFPASSIADYVAGSYIEPRDVEDRLMRAYVNGWTVEKPKQWNVKVPHTGAGWWYAKPDPDINHGNGCARPAFTGINNPQVRLTDAEIIKYDLQDCEKREVKE